MTSEQKLKKRIFWFMLISKIIVVLFITFHWATGGFSKTEAFAAIMTILPLFTVYTTVMVKDYTKNRYHEQSVEDKKMTSTFSAFTYFIFPAYLLIILYVITLKPKGEMAFTDLQTTTAIIETAFGVYIGQIVFALFKKE